MTVGKFKRGQGRPTAFRELKDAIQYLEIMPGSTIVESELSEKLGVSRTPIREALIRLSEEHLVNIYPQSGTYVAKISFELAYEVAYMRHLLDSDISLKLCRERVKISDAIDEPIYFMQTAIRCGDIVSYIRHDNQFHGKIFELAGHSTIWNIISNSRAHYNRVLTLDLRRLGRLEQSLEAHKKIVEFIESGDEKSLISVMDQHHDHHPDKEWEKEMCSLFPEYFPE